MASRVRVVVLALALAAAGASCSFSRTVALHSVDTGDACAGIGFESVLHGSELDPNVAWLQSLRGAIRREISWPRGYTARFTPGLEILDKTGHSILREGDYVDGACVGGGDQLIMEPPFLALRLDCGGLAVETCTSGVFRVATANGWPDREIASLTFAGDGTYQLRYEDGTSVTGVAPKP